MCLSLRRGHLLIYPSIHPSVLITYLPTCVPTYLYTYLPIDLPRKNFNHQNVFTVRPCVRRSTYLPTYLPTYLTSVKTPVTYPPNRCVCLCSDRVPWRPGVPGVREPLRAHVPQPGTAGGLQGVVRGGLQLSGRPGAQRRGSVHGRHAVPLCLRWTRVPRRLHNAQGHRDLVNVRLGT